MTSKHARFHIKQIITWLRQVTRARASAFPETSGHVSWGGGMETDVSLALVFNPFPPFPELSLNR